MTGLTSARRREGPLDAAVLDAGLRQMLVSLRQIGRAGHRVGALEFDGDAPVPAFHSRWCDLNTRLPGLEQPDVIILDALTSFLKAHPARVVLAGHDGTIAFVRRHRGEIERECALALASEDALEMAVDKDRSLSLATQLGIAVPRTFVARGTEDLRTAADELGFPAVVKPTESWLGTGAVAARMTAACVRSSQELERASTAVFSLGGTVLVQPWLSGRREAVMTLLAHGSLRALFAQVAWRMTPPLGGASVLRESIPVAPDVGQAARSLVETMRLEGFAEVEFRRDSRGTPMLMEVNPRLSASVEVAVRSGVDFPALLWRWAAGEIVPAVQSYRVGVRMRWFGGEVDWLQEVLARQGEPDVPTSSQAVTALVRDTARRAAYDYLDRHDPLPGLVATADGARSLSTRAGRRASRQLGSRVIAGLGRG